MENITGEGIFTEDSSELTIKDTIFSNSKTKSKGFINSNAEKAFMVTIVKKVTYIFLLVRFF